MEWLNTAFYYLLNMSLTACFILAGLLLVRLIRPLPRRAVRVLWLLPFLRLAVPFAPVAPWSLFALADGFVKRSVPVEELVGMRVPILDGMVMSNVFGAAATYAPVTYRDVGLLRLFSILSVVWISVAATLLLVAATLYAASRRALLNGAVTSPVLVGIFRPKLLLPPGFVPDSTAGRMILAHEEVHRRRGDNFWRVAALCTACLHWFNPLCWIGLSAFFTDLEGACDEAVIRARPPEERRDYAAALLSYAESSRRPLAASPFGGAARARILRVLDYKRLTAVGVVLSALFLIAIAAIFLTNPQLRG